MNHSIRIWEMALLLGAFSQCVVAGTRDTSWSQDYASELPADVRGRLQNLRSATPAASIDRSTPQARQSVKAQREQFLKSLPDAEQERLRVKIRQLEERPKSSRTAPSSFRDQ
jgi:hypothetical protein